MATIQTQGFTLDDSGKRIVVDPITRIEGHLRIEVNVDKDNYDDTLALIAALDEVVTVTTAVVHACGAMGRTCRVLVPEAPMWRYAYRCHEGMIWYPRGSIEMHRQTPGEDWCMTIKRLAKSMKPRILLAA